MPNADAGEALRVHQFPGLAFRGDPERRRPWVVGTGLDVWEIVQMLDDFGSPDRLIESQGLTEQQVRLALAYRERYPEEIDAAVAENRRPANEWRELFPFIVTDEQTS